VDEGHGGPNSLDLAPEAKAPDYLATTSDGCSPSSQVGACDSPPSASVDAKYGPVLGVDPHMSPEVLGSTPSMFEHDVIGPFSAAEVLILIFQCTLETRILLRRKIQQTLTKPVPILKFKHCLDLIGVLCFTPPFTSIIEELAHIEKKSDKVGEKQSVN